MRKSVKVLLSAAIAMTAFLTVGKVDSKAAVTGVKQTEGRNTSISLSWNAELGAKSYAVHLAVCSHTHCGYPLDRSIHDRDYGSLKQGRMA